MNRSRHRKPSVARRRPHHPATPAPDEGLVTGTGARAERDEPEPPPGTPHLRMRPLPGLQALRGIAALLVVLTHAAEEASNRGGSFDLLPFGNFGVDIFFVISGFIIVYSSTPAFARPGAPVDFMLRRLARVVPLYWIMSTAYLVLILAVREHRGLTPHYVLSSYLFIPVREPEDSGFFPFYFPGWTLEFEMFFYLCFATVLVWRRSVALPAICCIMAAVVAIGNLTVHGQNALSFWATSQLFEFVAGCLLAEIYLRGLRLPAPVCLGLACAAAAAVLVTSYWLGGWPDLRGLVWGPPAAALVAASVLRARPPTSAVMTGLARLGDASYSLYVVHYLVFTAAAHAIKGKFPDGSLLRPMGYIGLIVTLAIGAAFLSYRLLERPMTRWLQRRIPTPG